MPWVEGTSGADMLHNLTALSGVGFDNIVSCAFCMAFAWR
jgi:hypothetical protein